MQVLCEGEQLLLELLWCRCSDRGVVLDGAEAEDLADIIQEPAAVRMIFGQSMLYAPLDMPDILRHADKQPGVMPAQPVMRGQVDTRDAAKAKAEAFDRLWHAVCKQRASQRGRHTSCIHA